MVVIFENVKDIRWESLPEAYKTSPYFSLNNSVIFSSTDHPQHSEENFIKVNMKNIDKLC